MIERTLKIIILIERGVDCIRYRFFFFFRKTINFYFYLPNEDNK